MISLLISLMQVTNYWHDVVHLSRELWALYGSTYDVAY